MIGRRIPKKVPLRALALMTLGLFVSGVASLAAIPQAEHDALLAFYASAGGPAWIDGSNWGGPIGSENTWYGVITDPDDTTVLALRLGNNNVTGALPASMAALTNLEEIDLSGNPIENALGSREETVTASMAAPPAEGDPADGALLDQPRIVSVEFRLREQNGVVLVCKMTLGGFDFQPNCQVRINGTPTPKTLYQGDREVIAKGGAKLKKMLPKGQAVQIAVANPDGTVSAPYPFSRP